MRWLKLQQAQQLLVSFLPIFEKRDLASKRLSPGGPARRAGIVDRRLFAALRAGVKATWLNVSCCIRETLYAVPGALSGIA